MPKNPFGEAFEDDYDFGFTFADEDEVVADTKVYASLQEEIEDLKSRLKSLNAIFLPLLENLAKDPDKPMIKWPNRKDIIEKQITKLKTLTKV
jgi:hypothetical protein